MVESMTAFRLVAWNTPGQFCEVATPEPGPGEVRVRVTAVGLCHTDVHLMETPAGVYPWRVPFTLGHENAGVIDELGPGVEGLHAGQPVLLDAHYICDRCEYCRRGYDNYCVEWNGRTQGAGADGGLARFIVARARNVVPLQALSPAQAAPLADAGRTSYHAVKRAQSRLAPGSNALVIGAGGLGSYAIQWLRVLTQARVIAVDVAPHRLTSARDLGAHEAIASGERVTEAVRDATEGRGAEAVFDFVGIDATMRLAFASGRRLGSIAIVGAGGGAAKVGWQLVPNECDVYIPLGGSHPELHEVVALAERGLVRSEVELFAFDQTPAAYERVHHGDIAGRAVVVPE